METGTNKLGVWAFQKPKAHKLRSINKLWVSLWTWVLTLMTQCKYLSGNEFMWQFKWANKHETEQWTYAQQGDTASYQKQQRYRDRIQ